jgi:hypothetical protein
MTAHMYASSGKNG